MSEPAANDLDELQQQFPDWDIRRESTLSGSELLAVRQPDASDILRSPSICVLRARLLQTHHQEEDPR